MLLVQELIVGLIVALCVLGAVWALLPGAARRACARHMLRLPLPAPVAARLQRAALAQGGCSGCRHASAEHGTAPIRLRVVRKAGSGD